MKRKTKGRGQPACATRGLPARNGRGNGRFRRRRGLVVAIGTAVAGLLALPAVADAVSVSWSHLDGSGTHLEIRVNGTAAEVNDIRVTEHSTDPLIYIREANGSNSISAQGGLCTLGGGSNTVQCVPWVNGPNPRVTLRVTMRDGNDRYTGPPTRHTWTAGGQPIEKRAIVEGGGGNDVLVGGRWQSELYGGPGSDVLEAGAVGGNVLVGGTGFDVVRAKNGHPDQLVMCGQGGSSPSTSGRAVVDSSDPAPQRCNVVADHIGIDFAGTQEYTNDPTPSFTFSARFNEPYGALECRFNDSSWSLWLCNPSQWSFQDGVNTYEVRARDIAGIWAPAVKHQWTVDTIPPEVTITDGPGEGPGSVVAGDEARFWWTIDDATPTTSECRLDDGGWQPCSSPHAFAGFDDGAHTFALRVTDAAGNESQAAYEWVADTVDPKITIVSGPGDGPGSVVATDVAEFEWTVDDETETSTECRRYRLGSTPPEWELCTSPSSYAGLESFTHRFEVRATDAAGNRVVASYDWTIDMLAPTVEGDGFGPRIVTNDPRPPLPKFGSPSGNVDRFECRVDGEDPWRLCSSGRPWSGPDLGDGVRKIAVRAVSVGGLASEAPHPEQEYLIDTVPPLVSFDPGQDPSRSEVVRARYVEKGSGFDSAEIAARPRNSHARWQPLPTSERDGRIWAPLDSLPPGLYEFRARVTDKAGNHGTSRQTSEGTDLVLNIALTRTELSSQWPGRQARRMIVKHGKRAQVVGRLRVTGSGPLAGHHVRVLERFRAGSARKQRSRTVRTDARGEFAVNVPRGPSREVQVSYRGSGRFAPAAAERLVLGVKGRARLRAAKRVRAGNAVRFRGRVRCRGSLELPRGKIVRLQVRVRKRWQTVRNPRRTKGNGRFRLRYRFGDFYTRPVRYRFRLRVPAEQGWPCRATRSNVRRVRVIP